MQAVSNKKVFFAIIAVFAACVILGCWLLTLPNEEESYVPSEASIRSKPTVQPFLLEPSRIEGIYAGMETASLLFRYETARESGSEWRAALESAATAAGWEKVRDSGPELRFQRLLRAEPTNRRRATSEEVRVHRLPDRARVVVAWMLVDNEKRPDPIAEGPRAEWAEATFWPQYELAKQ